MADDIYDYFSGNAPKKVEPVQDDDFDSMDDDKGLDSDSGSEAEKRDSDILAADAGSECSPERLAQESVTEPMESEGCHWESLAGTLGIEPAPQSRTVEKSPVFDSAPTEAAPAKEIEPAPELVSEVDPLKSLLDQSEIPDIGWDPVPADIPGELSDPEVSEQAEAASELSGFEPIGDSDDTSVLNSMFHSEDQADETGDAGLEEIAIGDEELDEGDEFLEFEIEDLDESPYREGEEEAAGRRSRRPSRSNVRSDQPSRSRRGRTEDRGDDNESNERGSRSRRRSGRSRRDRDDSVRSGEVRSDAKSLDDEIGWSTDGDDEMATSRSSVEEDSGGDEARSGTNRRRRRRKRSGDGRSAGRGADRSGDRDDRTDDDALRSEEDYARVHRRSSGDDEVRGSRSRRGRESDDDSTETSGRSRFPTWEEAISGLVDTNIKNHSQSSGKGRGKGNSRGRGRKRSR